jgi:hypothetical protein
MKRNTEMARRNPLLLLTAVFLSATLQLALPKLPIEIPGAEGDSRQERTIVSPRETKLDTSVGGGVTRQP